jgi:hypothetical protein
MSYITRYITVFMKFRRSQYSQFLDFNKNNNN